MRLGFFVILIDQVTKICALAFMRKPVVLAPFLSLQLCFNPGITWGVGGTLSGGARYFLVVCTIFAICAVAWWIRALARAHKNYTPQLCILAAGLSNLIDRFIHGGVVDFIVLSWRSFSWPAFNVADVVIVLAIGYILVQERRTS